MIQYVPSPTWSRNNMILSWSFIWGGGLILALQAAWSRPVKLGMNMAAKVWWTHQLLCIYRLKKGSLIPNRNFRFKDFGFAGCNLHLQNVKFRSGISWTHPKRPIGHWKGHSLPRRLEAISKNAKRIHLQDFSTKQFVVIRHYLGIQQL